LCSALSVIGAAGAFYNVNEINLLNALDRHSLSRIFTLPGVIARQHGGKTPMRRTPLELRPRSFHEHFEHSRSLRIDSPTGFWISFPRTEDDLESGRYGQFQGELALLHIPDFLTIF
jgi:hypothetical protein